MVSAYRTGLVAGSALAQRWPSLDLPAQYRTARAELVKRGRDGIAHCEPEPEFIQGFLDGYKSSPSLMDGLTLFLSLKD